MKMIAFHSGCQIFINPVKMAKIGPDWPKLSKTAKHETAKNSMLGSFWSFFNPTNFSDNFASLRLLQIAV